MNPQEILKKFKKIAVVGLSPEPDRPSYRVTQYMKDQGYQICGVRPGGLNEILGLPVYEKLSNVPAPLEIVDVFRASEHVPPIIDEAIRLGAKVIWLQEGVHSPKAEESAKQAGLQVVSNKCILKEHRKL